MRRGFNLALGMALTGLAVWTLYRVLQLAMTTELGPDGGYFVVRSWQVRDGEIPYRDFYWWHTPGILYLLRYSASLFGENHASLAWQVLIQQLATLILLLAVMRRLFDSSLRPLALGATVFLASVPIFEGLALMLEPPMNLFGWLALWLALGVGQRANDHDRRTWALAFAAGLAAGLSFWMKQQGALFVLLVAVLPSLASGRQRLRPALVSALGAALIPLSFVAVHPDAVVPAWHMFGDLTRYATGQDKYAVGDTSYWIRRAPWVGILPLLAAVAATVRLFLPGDPVERRRARLVAACAATGAVLTLPCFFQPYAHYLLVPLPFAVLALAFLVRLGSRAGWRWAAVTACASAAAVVIPSWRMANDFERILLHDLRPGGLREERRIAAFIARHAGSAPRVYIAPNVPQYYVHTGKMGVDGDYIYLPDDARVRASLTSGVPAFIVNRGGASIAHYESLFHAAGYTLTDRRPRVSAWKPPARIPIR